MQEINLTQLMEVIPHYFDLKISLYLWGKPSTGKTSLIRQYAQKKAKDLGLEYSEDTYGPNIFTLKVIPLSQFDSPDLRGMPRIEGEGDKKVTCFIPSQELPREGQGIVFFDEMNNADFLYNCPLKTSSD